MKHILSFLFIILFSNSIISQIKIQFNDTTYVKEIQGFDKNGELGKIYVFKQNITDTIYHVYYSIKNNTIKFKGRITKGKQNGLCSEYYKNGNLHWEANFIDDNVLDTFKSYHSNGNLYHVQTYKEFKPEKSYFYNETGIPIEKKEYQIK